MMSCRRKYIGQVELQSPRDVRSLPYFLQRLDERIRDNALREDGPVKR